MPHAALWVVQPSSLAQARKPRLCFNAARGFVGGAANYWYMKINTWEVSMPHAALWVVQPLAKVRYTRMSRFNAARGFVGGAAI